MNSAEAHAVYWPRGRRTLPMQPLSPRLETLNGKTIAFVWDYLFRGDEIFPIIERKVRERFSDVTFVGYDAFGSTHGDHERAVLKALPERLRSLKVDAVISGMGC